MKRPQGNKNFQRDFLTITFLGFFFVFIFNRRMVSNRKISQVMSTAKLKEQPAMRFTLA